MASSTGSYPENGSSWLTKPFKMHQYNLSKASANYCKPLNGIEWVDKIQIDQIFIRKYFKSIELKYFKIM